MDFRDVSNWLPRTAYIIVAAGALYLLLRFNRRYDLAAWFKTMREYSDRAGRDENFRISELRMAEADLSANPLPDSIAPIRRWHEFCVHGLPKLLFLAGVGGFIILYFGLFGTEGGRGANWMAIAGPFLLAATGIAIPATADMRRNHGHVRNLNLLYIMQKAGGDVAAPLRTMEDIMKFFPAIPQLWLEKADMLMKLGRLDEALAAIGRSRELSPADMDLAVIEASYHFRKGDFDAAAPIVSSLAGLRKAETDPRPNIYAAALALKRGDKKAAKEEAEWAVKLDAPFTKRFLSREDTLGELRSFMKECKLVDQDRESA